MLNLWCTCLTYTAHFNYKLPKNMLDKIGITETTKMNRTLSITRLKFRSEKR